METAIKKRGFKFYLNIYFKIIIQDMKSKMSYRADFIISTVGMIFTNIAGFVAFYLMFTKFPSINGWSYYEMLFLYGFSLIAITPTQCILDNNWSLRNYVYEGDFIKYCFRPINLFFYYESEIFDIKGLGQLFFGIATLVYSWNKIGLPVSALIILQVILSLIGASLFMMAMQNAASATCFWMKNSFFILDLSLKLKDFAKYPVTIFDSVFRFIFTFILPVGFMAYYPSLQFLRPNEPSILTILSPLIGALYFYLSYKLWMKGASKYDGSGS